LSCRSSISSSFLSPSPMEFALILLLSRQVCQRGFFGSSRGSPQSCQLHTPVPYAKSSSINNHLGFAHLFDVRGRDHRGAAGMTTAKTVAVSGLPGALASSTW
jgi:hypothetical protein